MSHQVSHSLTAHASYTHARAMASRGFIDTVNQIYQSRALSTTNDVNHSVTVNAVAYLPLGKGRLFFSGANRWMDELINGWEVSPILTWYSGFAWRPGGNWEMASTGAPVNQSMGVAHTILPPDASHKGTRIRGVTPCVGTRDPETNAVILGPAGVAAGCTSARFVTAASGFSVVRPNIDFGVRQPGAYSFDSSFSKNFKYPRSYEGLPLGENELADSRGFDQRVQPPELG